MSPPPLPQPQGAPAPRGFPRYWCPRGPYHIPVPPQPRRHRCTEVSANPSTCGSGVPAVPAPPASPHSIPVPSSLGSTEIPVPPSPGGFGAPALPVPPQPRQLRAPAEPQARLLRGSRATGAPRPPAPAAPGPRCAPAPGSPPRPRRSPWAHGARSLPAARRGSAGLSTARHGLGGGEGRDGRDGRGEEGRGGAARPGLAAERGLGAGAQPTPSSRSRGLHGRWAPAAGRGVGDIPSHHPPPPPPSRGVRALCQPQRIRCAGGTARLPPPASLPEEHPLPRGAGEHPHPQRAPAARPCPGISCSTERRGFGWRARPGLEGGSESAT